MSTPEQIAPPVRSADAHLVGVSNTVLVNHVRVQVWDDYTRDADGYAVRQADVRLTVEQSLALIAQLSAAVQHAVHVDLVKAQNRAAN